MEKRFLVILSALAIVACSNENKNTPEEVGYMEFGATLEQPTKANLNGSLNTLWATGDALRVYVSNDANSWNTVASFDLVAGNGTTSGTFRCATDYSSGNHWDWYAFFPYNYHDGIGSSATMESNMGGDGFYFKLPESYYDYTSGQSFLPLLADMTGGDPQPKSASFKFVGGAVVLDLTAVPGAAHSIGLTVEGKNIFGWQNKVVLSEVGTASGIITAGDGSNSSVWLNFDGSGSDPRDFKFIFPVPTISSKSNLTFTMYDKNDLVIWQKTASGQSEIGRAQALVMPELAVVAKPKDMVLVGYINGADKDTSTGYAFNDATGTVSVTITSDSYVCLGHKTTGNWYMTDAYVGSGNTATVKKQSGEKLFVPAGSYTFSMAYQSDGSIVLSYSAD